MLIFEIILVVLLLGVWMSLNDISFTFASVIQTGAIRIRVMTLILLLSLSIGFISFRSSIWDLYENTWNISSPIVAIVIAFSASMTMLLLKKVGPANSVCYAIFGAILGWQVFNQVKLTDTLLIPSLTAWVLTPVLSGGLAFLLYSLLQGIIRKSNIHLLHLNSFFRVGIITMVILLAMAIGTNNGSLFMSVVHSENLDFGLDFGFFFLDDQPLLWMIALIILTSCMTVPMKRNLIQFGNKIMDMNIIAVFTALTAGMLVLFFFSFPWACGTVGLSVMAVSPVHAIIGAIAGIGFVRKRKEIEVSTLARTGVSLFITPALSFGFAHSLLRLIDLPGLMQRDGAENLSTPEQVVNVTIPLILILFILFIIFTGFSFRHQQIKRIQAQNALKEEQHQRFEAQQEMISMELKTIQLENERLNTKLEIKRKELIDLALDISEQRKFFDSIFQEIKRVQSIDDLNEVKIGLGNIAQTISSRMTFSNEMSGFYTQVEELHKNFVTKLLERFPDITEQEKRLATLLRLGFSTKDIAGLMSISPKSVEIGRYRLRKKLELTREDNLMQYIKSL